jgi:CO/xanthine dehydrogenase Mo-binding subunit
LKTHERFVSDIFLEDMLYAVTIRSPVSGGRLKAIRCPSLPESCRLITAADIPGKNKLGCFPLPILADVELSYIGEPLAILTGPNKEELNDVFRSTMVITEDGEENERANVFAVREIVFGQAEELLAQSQKIVSGTYRTGTQAHLYPEPCGAVVCLAEDGLTVYTATQWPYHVKRSVEQVLAKEGLNVNVKATYAAFHLDGKIWYPSLVACHAAIAAFVTQKPVKLILSGVEDFLYSPKRNKAEITLKSAVGESGELLATALSAVLPLGSQGIFAEEIIDHTCAGAFGLYRREAFKINAACVGGIIPPQGMMAGFGLSQGFFAAERHASRIADSLGEDPAVWRKNNFLKAKQNLPIGTSLKDSVPLPELIDSVAAMSDYYRKWASYQMQKNSRRGKGILFSDKPLRGIGIAIACQGNGFLYNDECGNGNCTVEVCLDMDSSLVIKTSAVFSETQRFLDAASDVGAVDVVDLQSGETPCPPPVIWQEMAASILGVEKSLVRVISDTSLAPDSGAATLSRNIGVITKLLEKCLTAIRSKRFRSPLPITVKRTTKYSRESSWGGGGKNICTDVFSRPSWGAAVVEVEIDSSVLFPFVRGVWLVADGGKILSQRRARAALRSGVIHSLSWCRENELYYKDGVIPKELIALEEMASPRNCPPIDVDFIWNDSADPKGIGVLPFCCVPAAFVQAVSQALDYHFEKIPLSERDIWEAAQLAAQPTAQPAAQAAAETTEQLESQPSAVTAEQQAQQNGGNV